MLSNIHTLKDSKELNQGIYDLAKKWEKLEFEPYFDTVNIPTIGIGVNLEVKEYRNYVFMEMNITDDKHKEAYIKILTDEKASLIKEMADKLQEKKDDLTTKSNGALHNNLDFVYKKYNPKSDKDFFKNISVVTNKDINEALNEANITDKSQREEYNKIWTFEKQAFDVEIKDIYRDKGKDEGEIREKHDMALRTALNIEYQELSSVQDNKFELKDPQPKNIFDKISKEKIDKLDDILKIGKDDALISDKNSKEYMVLADLTYNGGTKIIGKGLKDALKNDNRAEAWYEIRYNSNGGDSRSKGIANRRVDESDEFGLYADKDNITADEAKNAIRMYTLHKDKITSEETAFPATKNSPNPYSDFNSITEQLKPAKTHFEKLIKEQIGQDINIDDITVGAGLDNFSYKGSKVEKLEADIKGSDKNNLIFAEKTSGTISAGKGDDIIYAGEGTKTIKGEDGNDTYVYAKTDNADITIDDSSEDKDSKEDKLIIQGYSIDDADIKTSEDKKDLIITLGDGNEQITVKDYEGKGKIESFRLDDKTYNLDEIKEKITQPDTTIAENNDNDLGKMLLATTQEAFELSDEDIKEFLEHPIITEKEIAELEIEVEMKIARELSKANEKDNADDNDNVRRHTMG